MIQGRRRHILIVEDDRAIALGLEALLRGEGYSVSRASSGEEAIRRIGSDAPSLVLLDVNLPGISGLDVCRRIRADGFTRPVLILSSRGERADRVTGFDAGADDYVTKPFNNEDLLSRVRAQLRNPGGR